MSALLNYRANLTVIFQLSSWTVTLNQTNVTGWQVLTRHTFGQEIKHGTIRGDRIMITPLELVWIYILFDK